MGYTSRGRETARCLAGLRVGWKSRSVLNPQGETHMKFAIAALALAAGSANAQLISEFEPNPADRM